MFPEFVCGTIEYQMNFCLVQNVAKCSRFVMIISFEWNAGIHMEFTDINVKRTALYCLSTFISAYLHI